MRFLNKFGAALSALLVTLLSDGTIGAEMLDITHWFSTTYYRYDINSGAGGNGIIRITAVDEYELFLNGSRVGADVAWETMEAYQVSLESGKNSIAVVVQNQGVGPGAGLMLEAEVGDEQFASMTDQPWFWTGTPPEDDGWQTADVTRDEAWTRVQDGSAELGAVAGFQSLEVESIAGFPGGVDASRDSAGLLQMRRVEGENLALGSFSRPPGLADGSLLTFWSAGAGALNEPGRLDLGRRIEVNRVRVITQGKKPQDYEANSLRGYSVQISDDLSRWTEVASIFGITNFRETEVSFPEVETRHIQVVIAEVRRGQGSKVAEIEVFGTGFAEEGQYTSEPLNFGSSTSLKNFGTVSWDADVPKRTSMELQFRSAGRDQVWSEWSDPVSESGVAANVPEPAIFLQYRVNFTTSDRRRSPVLRSLQIEFDTDAMPVRQALGSVQPLRVPLGRDTTFVYTLDMDVAEPGIEKIGIDVPSWAELAGPVEGLGSSSIQTTAAYDPARQQFAVSFDPAVQPSDDISSLTIPFSTAQYIPLFNYVAHIFAPGSENPVTASENRVVDVESSTVLQSWSVVISQSLDQVLLRVRPNPQVFTPNGDDRNDFTVIEFVLAKVSKRQNVDIAIFALDGRKVRSLRGGNLRAGTYFHPGTAELAASAPGQWDGKDDGGNTVPPGIYLYQVEARLDGSNVRRGGTVGLAY